MEKQTVQQIRADVDRAKVLAMRNFERDWGTRDVAKVVTALRHTIPNSASPADAAKRARAAIARATAEHS